MTSAYILVIAILLLGGLIAALGDRIGSKVGKARLRLFQLRPKQTAIVITIATGTLISASTLIILFTFSESLRQGIFELDEILRKRREITAELETVRGEKERIEAELLNAQQRQDDVIEQLNIKEKELINSQTRVKKIEQQTNNLTKEVNVIIEEKQKLLDEKEQLNRESEALRQSIIERDQQLENSDKQLAERDNQLKIKENQIENQEKFLQEQEQTLFKLQEKQANLQEEIRKRDSQIAELDRRISETDNILKTKEEELTSLEKQLNFFREEVEILEQYFQTYQDLRERPIAIVKGQILTVTLVAIKKETNITELIDGILNEANRGVMATLGYGNDMANERFVQISKAQVEQIKQQLSIPGQYLVRILSAGNYVQGEDKIRIFADVTPNQIVYQANQPIASISLEKEDLNSSELQEKLDFLISVSQFRARREGILGQIVIGDGKIISLVNFLQELQSSDRNIDRIVTFAATETYTSGPLQINLAVFSNGEEIFRL